MKALVPIAFDPHRARQDVTDFRALLAASPSLGEVRDLLPFFRDRPHLAALVGCIESYTGTIDRYAFEYDLFGDFAADLVAGDSTRRAFVFVEFEDATPTSLFVRRGRRAAPAWSPRFERGYSQVVDWFHKLDDMERTDEYEARFGPRPVQYFGLLVVGRSAGLGPRETRRLAWRQDRTVVNSRHVRCLTFDQFADVLTDCLVRFPPAAP